MANNSPLYDGSTYIDSSPAIDLPSIPNQHPALLPYPDLGVGLRLALATRQHCTCACQLRLPYLTLPTLTKL
jgi:hypothetical protein